MAGLLAAVIALLLLATRDPDSPTHALVEEWEQEVFHHATFGVFRDDGTLSAARLLSDIGFDGDEVIERLILKGVPGHAFALPHYRTGELPEAELRERDCLAQAIYYEARNQSVVGRLAVADVVLNRVADERFPGSICGVVFEGQSRAHRCQFTFACDGSLDRRKEPRAWKRAEALADVIYRGFQPPVTRLATFYHADHVKPYWSRSFEQAVTIGDHVFYRPPGALEIAARTLGLDPGWFTDRAS